MFTVFILTETRYVDIQKATDEGYWLVPFSPSHHCLAISCW